MNIVLLSGGSGKRLWPLSNEILSKQFLKLLKNEQGKYESMVQRVVRQIHTEQPDVNMLVSCNTIQSDTLRNQIGAVETVLEPSRRDTYPAIVLAAAYLHYEKKFDEIEVIVVCPIDVFAENEYFRLLTQVEKLVVSGRNEIGLLGVMPTYPSEKYGYIIQKNGNVMGFVEKPPQNSAEDLIARGALWNCGVFATRIDYVLNHARKYVEFDSFESLYDQYDRLPLNSFDYEVVENEHSIGAITYEGIWKDIGTWNTLTEEMTDNSIGHNVLISDSCHNTHVLNMLNIPIIVQDLAEAIVVASHDGILVTSKHGSSFLKPLVEQINLRPMYEQRRWGNYRVLEYIQDHEFSSLVKRMHMDVGKAISYQYHTKRSEVWVIIEGKGILTIDGIDSVVVPGSVINIPKDAKHSLLAATELEFIEVQLGTGELDEDDIVRITPH